MPFLIISKTFPEWKIILKCTESSHPTVILDIKLKTAIVKTEERNMLKKIFSLMFFFLLKKCKNRYAGKKNKEKKMQ